MSVQQNSEDTCTIGEFIDLQNSSLIYDDISLYNNDSINNYNFISYNLLNDYIDYMKEKALKVVLSDKEYNKYLYRPKLLAYDIYKNTELYYVILLLNNICNVKEFDFKELYMLKKNDIQSILSCIFNSEKHTLEENRLDCGM